MELDVRGRADHRGARRLQPPADPGNPGLRSDPVGAADGVPVGPGRRIRIPTVGIRTRITVIACAAFGVAVILGAVVLVWAVRDAVERSLDDRARAAADSVAAQATDGRLDVIATTVSSQVIDAATGRVIAASPDLHGRPRLSDRPPSGAIYLDPMPALGWDQARINALAATDPGGAPVLVYALVDQEQAAESVAAARTAAVIGGPLLVVLLGAAVWFGVGRALRPVERIRAQVAGITAGNLSQRVREPPGTDGVTRLARTMNAMLDRLQSAAARQDRFVADVSHELHSPLASTRAELEIARAHPDSTDWPAVTDELLADNRRMTRVVRDLLFLTRLDSNTPSTRAPVDLDDLVRGEVRRLVIPPGLRVNTTGIQPADLIGTPDELSRAVRNVLHNAVRHAHSRVRVEVSTAASRVRVTVADDGPGITETDRERIFERFTRLDDSRSRATGGAGLGLAITRDIITAHGGTITVTTAAEGGACFVIDLPDSRRRKRFRSVPSRSCRPSPGMSVPTPQRWLR